MHVRFRYNAIALALDLFTGRRPGNAVNGQRRVHRLPDAGEGKGHDLFRFVHPDYGKGDSDYQGGEHHPGAFASDEVQIGTEKGQEWQVSLCLQKVCVVVFKLE